MPGANYMGGKRNAAKARVKDTTGRLEKSFFGQRRLCAASQALGRNNIPSAGSLGGANISLGHAKGKVPPRNDLNTSSFIPSPIDVSPSTPRSRRRTKKILEAHSSSSNVGRSKVLDALDVSEPMFLRQVLDKILTMPDLAGISRNRTKPSVREVRQPQTSDESSPLQRTKRKRSVSELYEESGSLSNDYNMELNGIEIQDDDGLSEFADDIQGDVRSSTSSSRDYRSQRYSSSPKLPSSNYTPYSNPNSRENTGWKEGYPTSIVFRGLKNSSFTTTATYSFEEPTVYGTLFEQADPWETIGQILGLPNTKPSSSAIVETEERLMSEEITQLSETEDIEDELLSIGNEYDSALAIPELEELDGFFIGPSLFELDKNEDDL